MSHLSHRRLGQKLNILQCFNPLKIRADYFLYGFLSRLLMFVHLLGISGLAFTQSLMDDLRFYVLVNTISVISGNGWVIMKGSVQWNNQVYD